MASAKELIDKMIKNVDELRKLAPKVSVDTSNFITMSFYFNELRPVLLDLTTRRDVCRATSSPELQRLESAVNSVLVLTRQCSQRGRVYLLLNTGKVVSDIQERTQEVGHCLSFVPVLSLMSSITPDLHSKLAELRTQMRSAKFESEQGNVEISNLISSALQDPKLDRKQSSELLARILQHLNMPVKDANLLKEEVQKDLNASERDGRSMDAQQLWELKRLLGRAVLASDIRRLSTACALSLKIQKLLSVSVPEKFKCSITGQVMQDPVVLVEANYTYERSAIEEWFAKGNRTCPHTGEELKRLDLVPNVALRNEIEEDFECLNQKTLAVAIAGLDSQIVEDIDEALEALILLCDSKVYSDQLVILGGIPPLVQRLTTLETIPLKEKTMTVLAKIANLSQETKSAIMGAGVLPVLLRICSEGPPSAPTLTLLQELSKSEEVRTAITDEMGVITLIKLLNDHPNDEIGSLTEKVLENFWTHDSYVAIQMASAGMFKPLVACLGAEHDIETRITMADAVMTWGVNMASRVLLVEAGVVPPLLDLLGKGPKEAQVAAARALEHLSHTEANRVALAKAGIIPALSKARNRGIEELKIAAAATLANLAMDDQDLDSLDEDGASMRLLALLRSTIPSSKEYAVRTLESMAKDSHLMRNCILQDEGAITSVFEVLLENRTQYSASSVRSSCLRLLKFMCQESKVSEVMVTNSDTISLLFDLMEKPIPAEEKDAIVITLAAMSGNSSMRPYLKRYGSALLTLLFDSLKKSGPGSESLHQHAFMGIARLADPDDIDFQSEVAKLGLIPMALRYLREGPDVMRHPAALLMGNLSLSTPALTGGKSVKKSFSGKSLFGSSKSFTDKRKQCRVHSGKCSLEGTYCLVEGDVVDVLLQLIKKAESSVGESSMLALATLLEDEDNLERVVDLFVKLEVIDAVSGMIGKTPTSTQNVVNILEKVFSFPKYRSSKFSQPAVMAMGKYMTMATGKNRKAASDALMRLDILPKGSYSESL